MNKYILYVIVTNLCISELLNWFRHVGDLGNILVIDGKVHTTIVDHVISLYGSQTILNRSIVVCILTNGR